MTPQRKTQVVITVASLALAGVHLLWPDLRIDAITLILLAAAAIPWLLPLFRVGTTCRRPLAVKGSFGTWQPRTEREVYLTRLLVERSIAAHEPVGRSDRHRGDPLDEQQLPALHRLERGTGAAGSPPPCLPDAVVPDRETGAAFVWVLQLSYRQGRTPQLQIGLLFQLREGPHRPVVRRAPLKDLLEVPYRHLVFTLPWELRLVIQDNRRVLLNVLFRAAADAVLSLSGQGPTPRGRKSQPWLAARRPSRRYLPGLIIVLHTFGSDLKWNPHLHMIVSRRRAQRRRRSLAGRPPTLSRPGPPAGYGVEVERPPRSAPRSPVPAPGASPASKRPPTPDRGGQALGAHSQEALAYPHRSVVEKCRPSRPLRLPLYQAARDCRRGALSSSLRAT